MALEHVAASLGAGAPEPTRPELLLAIYAEEDLDSVAVLRDGRLIVRKQDSAVATIQAAAEVLGARLFVHSFEADLCEREERAAVALPATELAMLERRRALAQLRAFFFSDLRIHASRGIGELREAVARLNKFQEQAANLAVEVGSALAKAERDLEEITLAAKDADALTDELGARIRDAGGDPAGEDEACLHAADLCNPDLEVGRRAVMR